MPLESFTVGTLTVELALIFIDCKEKMLIAYLKFYPLQQQ